MQIIKIISEYYRLLSFNPKRYWTKRGGKEYFDQYPLDEERNTSLILQTLDELDFDSLIDIGCGYGRYLKSIRKKFDHVQLTGVDISPTQIAEAKRFCNKLDIKFYETDGKRLPFKNNSFDVAFTYGCMIHVPYKWINSFFTDICRVTKRYGLFLESAATQKSLFNTTPHYFSHDYEALFINKGLEYQIVENLDEKSRESLWLVFF